MDAPLASDLSLCAVVVTYHPGASLVDSVQRLAAQVTEVVIVDNGSSGASFSTLAQAEQIPGVRILRNARNMGIAAALNQGICHALGKGYEWVTTFDQDSTVPPDFCSAMLSALKQCASPGTTKLVCPVHAYAETPPGNFAGERGAPATEYIQVAMTSGSLIRTDVFGRVGFYNEPWFIDYVDFEFCLRLRAAGYQILRANRVQLQHRLGSPEAHSVLGWRMHIKSHSAWRRYYIMRNRLLMYRQYASRFPGWCLHDLGWLFLDLAKIMVFESGKADKLRMVLKGLGHGLAGKTGPRVLPPP